jgi:hypothetical protein
MAVSVIAIPMAAQVLPVINSSPIGESPSKYRPVHTPLTGNMDCKIALRAHKPRTRVSTGSKFQSSLPARLTVKTVGIRIPVH